MTSSGTKSSKMRTLGFSWAWLTISPLRRMSSFAEREKETDTHTVCVCVCERGGIYSGIVIVPDTKGPCLGRRVRDASGGGEHAVTRESGAGKESFFASSPKLPLSAPDLSWEGSIGIADGQIITDGWTQRHSDGQFAARQERLARKFTPCSTDRTSK